MNTVLTRLCARQLRDRKSQTQKKAMGGALECHVISPFLSVMLEFVEKPSLHSNFCVISSNSALLGLLKTYV